MIFVRNVNKRTNALQFSSLVLRRIIGSRISNIQDNPIIRNNFVYRTICSFIASFSSGDDVVGLIDLDNRRKPFLFVVVFSDEI